MSTKYEFIPPGSVMPLWSWLSPGRSWGVALFFCPWCFDVGFECWRHGGSINVGPFALAAASIREPASDAFSVTAIEPDRSRDEPTT